MNLDLSWMAWTWQTATFFLTILGMLIFMTIWAIKAPQLPRMGFLRFETTPGDRLFISLLGSAFICLGWLAFFGGPLWGALGVCFIYAGSVFRWV
jgi:predicted small integral membrane protein